MPAHRARRCPLYAACDLDASRSIRRIVRLSTPARTRMGSGRARIRARAGRPHQRVSTPCHLCAHGDPGCRRSEHRICGNGRRRNLEERRRWCDLGKGWPLGQDTSVAFDRLFLGALRRDRRRGARVARPRRNLEQYRSSPRRRRRLRLRDCRRPRRTQPGARLTSFARSRRVLLSTNEGGLKICSTAARAGTRLRGSRAARFATSRSIPRTRAASTQVRSSPAAYLRASIAVRHGRATGSDQTSSMFGPSPSTVPVHTSSTPAPTARDSSGYGLRRDLYGPREWRNVAGRSSYHHRPRGRSTSVRGETDRSLSVRECRSHVDTGSDRGVVGHHDRRQ